MHRRIAGTEKRRSMLMIVLAGTVGAMLASANLMTFRHPLMMRDDVIFSGYFMPMLAVLVLFFALTFEIAYSAGFKKSGRWITLTAAVMTAAAVLRILHPVTPANDHLAFYKLTAPYLKSALKDPQMNYNSVTLPYSSTKLIEHFRRRSGQGQGADTATGK